jgi:dolichol kinase
MTEVRGSGTAAITDEVRSEFLDRYPWLAILLLILVPLIVHVPLWVSGRSTDPIWFTSGVTQGAPGLTGLPWIDPNVGVTSEALGRLEARDWLHGKIPWWNPYTGIGMPLAGELQPAAFFLPFVFLFLLPEGLLWEKILIQIFAGIATYALLRELGLSRLSACMGGALYGLSGTFAWSPGPAGVYCCLPFLPLLLWGIERARKASQGAISILAIGAAIAFSLLPGFPEPAYISGLFAVAWGVYRLAGEGERWRAARRGLLGLTLGLLVALPALIAFVDYSLLSPSFGAHKTGERSMIWAAFSSTLMPYVYGPLESSFHSPALNEIWARTGGYSGILIILLAVAGLTAHIGQRGLKILLAGWVLVCWAKSYGVQPVMALMNFIPLLRETQFYRYSQPSWIFALIVLAAFALDDLATRDPRRRVPFGIGLGLLVLGAALGWPLHAFWNRPAEMAGTMFVLMGLAVTWALVGILAAACAWTWLRGERRRTALVILVVFDAAVMFMVPEASSVRGSSIDEAAVQFLRQHQGLERTFTLDPLEPNYGAYFQVQSIDHNVLPVPRLWEEYIDQSLLPGYSKKDLGTTFFPSVNADGTGELVLNEFLPNYLDMAVRYVAIQPGRDLRPKTYLPGSDLASLPVITLRRTIMRRLGFLGSLVRKDSGPQRVLDDPDADKLRLANGQAAMVDAKSLPESPLGLPISSVGVVILKGDDPQDGLLKVELCADSDCSSGERSLLGSWQGNVFQVPLDRPLMAATGASWHLTLTLRDASQPLLLWMGPPAHTGQQVKGPGGARPGQELHLVFEYGPALPGAKRVYSDEVMDIWELPNPAPYFEVTSGGPCVLQASQRKRVTADCASAAALRRRELFMPGWDATVNGKSKPVKQDGIFESTALSAGHNTVRFSFVPPHEGVGLACCFVGLGGLLCEVFLVLRGRFSRVEGS